MRVLYSHRGGLSTIVATLVLIALVMAGIVAVAIYSRSVSTGAMKQANLIWDGSEVRLSMATGVGSVTIDIYNSGPGPIRLINVTLASKLGDFGIWFTTTAPYVAATAGTARLSGSTGVGTADESGTAVLGIPAGATLSIVVTITSPTDLRTYFSVGGTYQAKATPLEAPTYIFSVDANAG